MNNAVAEITSAAVLFVERCNRKRRRAVDSRDDLVVILRDGGTVEGRPSSTVSRSPFPRGKVLGKAKEKAALRRL